MPEQQLLIEEVLRSFRQSTVIMAPETPDVTPMSSLRGALKPATGVLPTDSEIDAMITDHLIEKYA